MSRGAGIVQKKIAALIAAGPAGPLDLDELFGLIYGDREPTRSLRGSLVRALHMLPAPWTFGRLPHDARRFLYDGSRPPKITVQLTVTNLSDVWTEIEVDDGVKGSRHQLTD
jgi:hypothetical protein